MEVIGIAEADTRTLEFGNPAEIIDADVDSFPPKSSSVEEIEVSECNKVKILTSDSITSSSNREAAEIPSTSYQTDDLEIRSDCETPTDNIFNPFAPGPEELALAPKKKILREIEVGARRQLKFVICRDLEEKVDSAISNEEACDLDSICESFPKLFESTPVNDRAEDNLSDGFKTPTSVPLLTGIADTCPGAPMRPAAKLRRVDQSSSCNLEFGS